MTSTTIDPAPDTTPRTRCKHGHGAHDHDTRALAGGHATGQAGAEHAAQAEARQQVSVALVAQAELAAEQEQQDRLGAVDGAGDDVGADEAQGRGLVEQRAGAVAQLAHDAGRGLGPAAGGEDRAGGDRGDGQR
jgi:hypothetical protein